MPRIREDLPPPAAPLNMCRAEPLLTPEQDPAPMCIDDVTSRGESALGLLNAPAPNLPSAGASASATAPRRIAPSDFESTLDFSATATASFKATCAHVAGAVHRQSDGTYLISGTDFTRARQMAEAERDPVQRDLLLSALDKMQAQGTREKDGSLKLGNETLATLIHSDTPRLYELRAKEALANPQLVALAARPELAEERRQLAELLVRYAADPVFDRTVNAHALPSGGATNAHQMWVGDKRTLHQVDEYFGQCNECQTRSAEIFDRFASSWSARHGADSLKLEGFEVSEASRVLLAYGLMGDGPGDVHELYGVSLGRNAPTFYLDPWLSQTTDQRSVFTPSAYREARDGLTSSHTYDEHRNVSRRPGIR